MKITKRQLSRIIKEERLKILKEAGPSDYANSSADEDHPMHARDDELRELGDVLSELVAVSTQMEVLMKDMGGRYGELTALGTDARMVQQSVKKLSDKFNQKLDDILRFST